MTDAGPEGTFLVGPPAMTGTGAAASVTGSMLTGPWLNGPAGTAPGGVLGVLIDGVSAFAVLLGRPHASWSVSAEISLDMCGPLPADGSVLAADARLFYADKDGGLAAGTVTGEQGQTVALYRQHNRWVSAPPELAAVEIAALLPRSPGEIPAPLNGPGEAGACANLVELLDARIHAADGGAIVDIPATAGLTNPLGNLHGGVIMTAVDLAAQAALLSVGGPTRTASVHVAYPRPVTGGTTARFDARITNRGRSLGIVQVTALNEKGKPAIIATVTTARG